MNDPRITAIPGPVPEIIVRYTKDMVCELVKADMYVKMGNLNIDPDSINVKVEVLQNYDEFTFLGINAEFKIK